MVPPSLRIVSYHGEPEIVVRALGPAWATNAPSKVAIVSSPVDGAQTLRQSIVVSNLIIIAGRAVGAGLGVAVETGDVTAADDCASIGIKELR